MKNLKSIAFATMTLSNMLGSLISGAYGATGAAFGVGLALKDEAAATLSSTKQTVLTTVVRKDAVFDECFCENCCLLAIASHGLFISCVCSIRRLLTSCLGSFALI